MTNLANGPIIFTYYAQSELSRSSLQYTLFRFYIDHDEPRKENEASKTPKGVMIEHEGTEFITYHYNLKGSKQAF